MVDSNGGFKVNKKLLDDSNGGTEDNKGEPLGPSGCTMLMRAALKPSEFIALEKRRRKQYETIRGNFIWDKH